MVVEYGTWFGSIIVIMEARPQSKKSLMLTNAAINAKYDYTPLEQDILLAIYSGIHDQDGNKIVIDMPTLGARYEEQSKAIYQEVKAAVTSLRNKSYTIFDESERSFLITGFISEALIEPYSRTITVTIPPRMRSILLEVKKEFTKVDFITFMSLQGKYSKRLYLMLSQFKKTGYRIMKVDELKDKFGLNEKYPQFRDFHKRVIAPAIEEINKLTNLKVTTENILSPSSRNIEAIKAHISPTLSGHNVNYGSNLNDERAPMRTALRSYGLSDWQVANIMSIKNDQEINQVIYRMKTGKKPVANTGAYLAASFKAAGVYLDSAIPQQYDLEDMVAEIEWEKTTKQSPTP